MGRPNRDEQRILAIHPTIKGFGFAVLEGPGELIDWGTKEGGHRTNSGSISKMYALIQRYHPDALVLEDRRSRAFRRSMRVTRLLAALTVLAEREKVTVQTYSRPQVREVFTGAGAQTKDDIARVIAGHFPELAPHLPPRRKPWMSQDTRMSIFDAVAWALASYFSTS